MSTIQRNTATALIYGLTAVASSAYMLSRNAGGETWSGERWGVLFFLWLLLCAVPLLFVFAYPRFLFAESAMHRRCMFAILLNSVGVVTTTVLFSILGTPFWTNPMRELEGSIPQALALFAVLGVFSVTALSLLIKNKSSLAMLASILFWPYWILIALALLDRWFQDSSIHAAYYFLCFATPIFFVFAAGAVLYRPVLGHAVALMGLLGVPWLYRDLIRGNELANVWIMFNQPDDKYANYPPYAILGIFTVALITFATTRGVLRLLPSRWTYRRTPVSERTWPGIAMSLTVVAVWFGQSVLPYRIPGAVDGSDYPVLQILHVEKRGLQFHERCFSVYWQRPYRPISISSSGSDRRLLRYRFRHNGASLQPPKALVEHLQTIIESSAHGKRQSDTVKPIWNWNADAWYFYVRGSGLRVYGTPSGSNPPQEIVDVFHELDRIPRYSEWHSELKDICLGFCYDALSAMGSLYSNRRCFNNGQGDVCR